MNPEHDPTTEQQAARQQAGKAWTAQDEEMALHEERAHLETEERARPVRIRKRVTEEPVSESVPRDIEEADIERASVEPEDSGEVEVLPDGSISIPLLEEEVMTTKRMIVRERLIVRKHVRTEQVHVETTLRSEHAELEGEDLDFNKDAPPDQQVA